MWEGNGGAAAHETAGFTGIVAELFGDLGRDARTLIRQEAELVRAELREEVSQAIRIAALGAAAILVGACAAMMLSVACALGLQEIFPALPLWGCFAIIAALEAALGATLGMAARNSGKHFSIVPHKTLESLQQGVQCLTRKR